MNSLALRAVRCHACYRNTLQSFIALSGVAIPPSPCRRTPVSLHQRAAISFSSARLADPPVLESRSKLNDTEVDVGKDIQPSAQQDGASATQDHVPWYLQDADAAETAPHPLGQRQALPPLPDNPPPILQTLLEHISIQLGLDDLAVIDLRGVIPPPPLGMNLVMIIGTARSEKHLNVSADRLCRWLRREHKLRPTADGLMGRNELKIKLRRKARRAKLAKSIGRNSDGRDHGLSTGWICCNVGEVEDGKTSKQNVAHPEVIGFGTTSNKARIAVQMLTEEMRAEFDLDDLWTRRRFNRTKHQHGDDDQVPGAGQSNEVGITPHTRFEPSSNPGLSAAYSRQAAAPFEQRRHMHTARHLLPEVDLHQGTELNEGALLQSLSRRSLQEIQRDLGLDGPFQESTAFLRLFSQSISKMGPERFLYQLKLIQIALPIGHERYTKTQLFETFEDLVASSAELPRSDALSLISTFLSPTERSSEGISSPVSDTDMNRALKVIEYLSLRGVDILDEDVLALLFRATAFDGPVRREEDSDVEPGTTVAGSTLDRVYETQNRLVKLMEFANVQLSQKNHLIILRVLFENRNDNMFWKLWRDRAIRCIPRTKEDYLLLFNLQAQRKHQRDVIKCLYDWVPMMAREDPPVYVDKDVARALVPCLLLADPQLEQRLSIGTKGGAFLEYFMACQNLLGEEYCRMKR